MPSSGDNNCIVPSFTAKTFLVQAYGEVNADPGCPTKSSFLNDSLERTLLNSSSDKAAFIAASEEATANILLIL